jgi:hypothetical protein
MEHALGLRGVRVISGEQGALLGRLCMVYIDPSANRLAAFSYRTGRVGGRELCVSTDEALTITDDLIVISSARAAQPLSHDTLPGPSLIQLVGRRITTVSGHHLGRLADLLFSNDWLIIGLLLDDRRRVSLRHHELSISEEMVVPEHCADELARCPDPVPSRLRAFIFGAPGSVSAQFKAGAHGSRRPQGAPCKPPPAE